MKFNITVSVLLSINEIEKILYLLLNFIDTHHSLLI